MKNMLFSHSYFMRFDPKQWDAGEPYAPLGTLYAAALIRENGYHVSLFDTMFAVSPAEVIPHIELKKPDFFVIYDDGFNYLTKMCLTNMRAAAFDMIKYAKARGCTVILSSSDSTDHYENYLNEGADFILMGEAELSLLALVNTISKNETNYFQVQGIAFKQDGNIIKTTKRNVMKDLDALPLPAWDLINMEPYRNMWLKSNGYFSMNMGTTRGCPFKCNWCAKPIYGNRYHSRSVPNVIDELRFLKQKYRFDHIWFCDDIFGLKPGWVQEFADLLGKENFSFKYKIQSRADLLLHDNYTSALARSGCDNAWIGAESGSQKILDAMDKGIKVEQVYQATKLLKQYHINPSFFIQFGYPGETMDDIHETIRMINELLPYSIGISVSYPLPGTLFYEKVKSDLQQKANWSDSDDLQLMFVNTYKPAFYKQLHRYVHAHFLRIKAGAYITNIFSKPQNIKLSDWKNILKLPYYILQEILLKFKLEAAKP